MLPSTTLERGAKSRVGPLRRPKKENKRHPTQKRPDFSVTDIARRRSLSKTGIHSSHRACFPLANHIRTYHNLLSCLTHWAQSFISNLDLYWRQGLNCALVLLSEQHTPSTLWPIGGIPTCWFRPLPCLELILKLRSMSNPEMAKKLLKWWLSAMVAQER